MSTFLAFLSLAAIVIITPGPDTAITIRNTLFAGRTGGMMTALGIASGQAIWALATSAGIVAILLASEPLFLAIKYAGAAYLIFLGLQALREAIRPSAAAATGEERPTRTLSAVAAFRQGVISDLGNPKMAVFFASLLPQFVPAENATFISFLLLGLIFALMTLAWLILYAIVVSKIGDVLRRPAVRRWIEGVTGSVLIALGVRVAAEQR
ncbi:MAG TPA: LysE family translocator [Microvirga sp.]|nr:LysE family translocator [Microvirga sp.]